MTVPDKWLAREVTNLSDDRLNEIREEAGYANVTVDADELIWLLDQAAEVDRLRAENTALSNRIEAFLEPHTLIHRNIAWTDETGVLHVTEVPVCGHCVPKHSHFHRREDIPEGPCPTARALGLDQDGGGND